MNGTITTPNLWRRIWARCSISKIVLYPEFYGKTLKERTVTLNGEAWIFSEFSQATQSSWLYFFLSVDAAGFGLHSMRSTVTDGGCSQDTHTHRKRIFTWPKGRQRFQVCAIIKKLSPSHHNAVLPVVSSHELLYISLTDPLAHLFFLHATFLGTNVHYTLRYDLTSR